MAILDYSEDIWRQALDISPGQEPTVLILEGTWWRETATKNRLSKLSNVRELNFPDMFMGEWHGVSVAYCCAYGAARAVEPAHIFAQLGTPLLIQIGTCGSLNADAATGTVVVPRTCLARDGVSEYYGAGASVTPDEQWSAKCADLLTEQGIKTLRSSHLTWPSLFAQSDKMCADWTQDGIDSIDMETSAVVTVAQYFGAASVAMLTVWDLLANQRTFLDPLSTEEREKLDRSNHEIFNVALQLATDIGQRQAA
jgi:purine-nucleoside phosphorylase